MAPVYVEKIGVTAVIECESRVVRSDVAYRLRNAVTALRDARIVVIDLSEVRLIEDGGLFVLMLLRRWAQEHDVRFKLFNPRKSVRDRLEAANSVPAFDFATLDEMLALLGRADTRNAIAA